jgi:hypothetical protein
MRRGGLKLKKKWLALPVIFALVGVVVVWHIVVAGTTSTVTATVQITVCGNGIVEAGEQCDGADLNGKTCVSRGFVGGTLLCSAACEFNTSNCITGGGGGGSGGTVYVPPKASVTLIGRAYPNSKVTALKDGQIAASTTIGTDGKFQVTLSDLAGGNYNFTVYSEDKYGNKSATVSIPISVTANTTVTASGIYIAPTTAVDKTEVQRGDNISIFGQGSPQSEITISVNSDSNIFLKTKSDASGIYLYTFDTSPLEIGSHQAKSKSATDGEISSFGDPANFKVSSVAPKKETTPAAKIKKGDLNNDSKISLVDFSILAYWYKRPLTAAFIEKEKTYLNGDGKVDLKDFSIMAYYWTG